MSYWNWSTADEVAFIRFLGTHKNPVQGYQRPCTVGEKRALLNGYLAGAKLRKVWGSIDSSHVIEYAEGELHLIRTLPAEIDAPKA